MSKDFEGFIEKNKRDKRLDNSLITSFEGDNLLSDVYIEHNSLPEMNFDEIDTKTKFLGQEVPFPLMINAMTGGTKQSVEINETLYNLSRELGLAMEIGSQEDLMSNPEISDLFLGELVKDKERENILISNLHSSFEIEYLQKALDHIKSDAIALHLNPAQDIVSKDGRKDFTGILENIKKCSEHFGDKLIVKEVGFGMSQETIQKLVDAGVKNIDVSGFGGTNFIEIENLRNIEYDFSDIYGWGVPTAKAILNARKVSKDVTIIASGGIKTSMDIIKALVLGADMVAISGELLKYLLHGGYDNAKDYLVNLIYKAKIIMFLLGARNIDELKKTPYKLTGKLKEINE